MPIARATRAFRNWMSQFPPAQRQSIASVILDLNAYGLPKWDPDMYTLDRDVDLGSVHAPGLTVNVYIQPHRISTGVGRAVKTWFGIVEVASGRADLVGLLLILKAWTSDPGTGLVAAQSELLILARAEIP